MRQSVQVNSKEECLGSQPVCRSLRRLHHRMAPVPGLVASNSDDKAASTKPRLHYPMGDLRTLFQE